MGFKLWVVRGWGRPKAQKPYLFEAQLLLGVSEARLELGIEVGGLRSLGQA